MKKITGNRIRLGVFVTISALLLIIAIYFIGQRQQLFNDTFKISGIFRDINGLQVGNNVRFSGINVGIVENIQQVTDTTVQVDMLVEEHARKFMKKNATAVIGSDGLMGNKIVSIIPGTPDKRELADKDFVQTIIPVNVDDILLKIKTTSDNAACITGNLSIIVQNIRDGKGTIGKLFMDSAMALNVSQAMANINQGAGGFKQNMNAASHNFLLKGYFKKKEKEDAKKSDK
jgi:phospholipid/cholesterol/gamma-HCH transport system substrate-binding protein